MKRRFGMILCILIGSFCVYCTQSAMTGRSGSTGTSGGSSGSGSGGSSGPIGNAMGDTCCSAPARETPTVIFDDTITPSPQPNPQICTTISPIFDVSAYRTVVIHTPQCGFSVQVRNGKAGFVFATETACSGDYGPSDLANALTVDTLLGHDLRVNFDSGIDAHNPDGVPGACDPVPLTVVGFKNP